MKKNEIKLNSVYLVKVASNVVPVRIDRVHSKGGWEGTSTKTGKTIRIKSAQRLRKRVDDGADVATKPAKPARTTKGATKRNTGQRVASSGKRGADSTKPLSLLDAAAQLLAGSHEPLRCQEIVTAVIEQRLWEPGDGKTPSNTLHAAISTEIKKKGDDSRFIKADRGKFALAKGA